MTIETKLEDKKSRLYIKTISKPEDFVIKTDNTKESIYERLNRNKNKQSYDAWCRHTD